MSVIKPKSYAQEHRLRFPDINTSTYAISGLADFSNHDASDDGHPTGSRIHGLGDGSSDERWFAVEQIHMIVGPRWRKVDDVCPTIAVAGISFLDSDETDATGYEITAIAWDIVDDPEGIGKRIRLKVDMRMCGGEQSTINMLSYYLIATGIFSQD